MEKRSGERFFLHDGTIKSMQIRSLVFTLANYLYQLPEIFGMNISDIADTESVGLRNLSRIDDKSTFFQLCVESFEVEIGIRIEERSNNGRLNLVRQQRLETEGTHAVHQHAVVLAINKGDNQNHLLVYGRGGEPCKTCGEPLATTKVGGRGTTYCAKCQH